MDINASTLHIYSHGELWLPILIIPFSANKLPALLIVGDCVPMRSLFFNLLELLIIISQVDKGSWVPLKERYLVAQTVGACCSLTVKSYATLPLQVKTNHFPIMLTLRCI